MSDETTVADKKAPSGMSPATAQRLEWGLIGLGIVRAGADIPAVQPGAVRNRLRACRLLGPGQQPLAALSAGDELRSLVVAGVIVALAFFVILLISITAAYLYGVFFVNAFAPDTSEPFYRQPFVWGAAAIAVALAALLTSLLRR